MNDLRDATMTVTRDPLVLTLVVFVLAGLLTHWLFRTRPLGRAIARVILLVALTIVLFESGVAPYQPLMWTGAPLRDGVHGALEVAWWLWAAWFLVGILRAFIITEHRPREGKLLQDLLAGFVYLAAGFAIIAYVLGSRSRGCSQPRVPLRSSLAWLCKAP